MIWFLWLLAAEGPTRDIRMLAAAALDGEDCLFALHDALEEGGIHVQG